MYFLKAKPIFLKNLSKEMNITAILKSSFCIQNTNDAKISLTGATFYRVKINEKFVCYGPARASHGHARVDVIDISSYVSVGENEVEIELVSYNTNSFYGVYQEGYLICEITSANNVLCATGYDFKGYRNLQREQKVMKYSYQRHFGEVYNYANERLCECDIEILDDSKTLLGRNAPLPDYQIINVKKVASVGKYRVDESYKPVKTRYIDIDPSLVFGFPLDEIEHRPAYIAQQAQFFDINVLSKEFSNTSIQEKEFALFDYCREHSGFIRLRITATKDSKIILLFEEYKNEDFISLRRLADQINNVVQLSIPVGTHEFESFEAYAFRYLEVLVEEGSVVIEKLSFKEYAYPTFDAPELNTTNEKLKEIYKAAIETFRQNSVDVYMDCPTRERAGWLCDSYYTSQSEFALTGKTLVEDDFLQNFAVVRNVPDLPKGMPAMAYPGDAMGGQHIPQWGMWGVLEIYDYLTKRSQNSDKELFRNYCYDLIDYLEQFINEDGLLEKIPNWNFVEWSKANEWVQDVNYPTNMLYARMLELVATLYSDDNLMKQSAKMKITVAEKSFNGEFFTDNAVRNDENILVNTGNISEVCQYYAFMFGIADINDSKYNKLKKVIYDILGPDHDKYGALGFEIEPANSLMGIYLRMELLIREKKYDLLVEEIEMYFGKMSELTGTLWEHNKISGSLNHGFASFVAVALLKVFNS